MAPNIEAIASNPEREREREREIESERARANERSLRVIVEVLELRTVDMFGL